MRVTAEQIKAKLEETAEDQPVVAWGLGYVGPSVYTVWSATLVVLLLGLAIALFTFRSGLGAAAVVALAALVYLVLRRRVKFTAMGVTPRHFIAIDITHGGKFLPPAHQGLSAIQYPRLIEKELSTILHYVLGDGTLHWVRFQDFRGFPDNRAAARRIRQAVHELVYEPHLYEASRR
ncbi:MAG: hypothetical protein HYY26_03385 [Acidobacteria bacterium]|nr:hypothetical protein [Acidobacteriota bacterium]